MAKKRNNLLSRSGTIANAQQDGENTAGRVGGLNGDIVAALIQPYDQASSYSAGDWCIDEGVLTEVLINAAPNETPVTNPEKYSRKIAGSSSDVTTNNHLPVSASAVAEIVEEKFKDGGSGKDVPNATENVWGKARRATDKEFSDGANNDAFVTSRQVQNQFKAYDERDVEVSLQEVTDVDGNTTNVICTAGYELSVLPEVATGDVLVLVKLPSGKYGVRRSSGAITPNPTTANYEGKITLNECTQVGGWIYNTGDLFTAAKGKLYIDGEFVADITATQSYPTKATDLGVSTATLLRWAYSVPAKYQDNNVHKIELRSIVTGAVLSTVSSLGVCGIQTVPQPTFRIIKHMQERAATPGVNPAPVLVNRIPDTVITDIGDVAITPPNNEYSDPGDVLTKNMTGYNAGSPGPFPAGVSYDSATDKLKIAGSVPSGTSFIVWRTCKDSAGQAGDPYYPLINVVRGGAYVKDYAIEGTAKLNEAGAEGNWHVVEIMSDDSRRVYLGGGVPAWNGGYPNGAFIYGFNNPEPGTWLAKIPADTLESDVTLQMGFTLPGGRVLSFDVTATNSVCTRPGGQTTYQLIWNFTPNGGQRNIFSTLSDANNILGAYYDGTLAGTPSTPFAATAASLAIGQKIYLGTGVDCSTLNDLIYYILANGAVNTIKKAVTIKNGVITDIQDSTYVTPVTPVTSCSALEEVAYVINSVGSGSAFDSVGFYYKGTAKIYKFYIQSNTNLQMELYASATNDQTVSLSGALSRFNHRIVQAVASRVWRGDIPYKVRLEIFDGVSSTPTKAIEFGVDMSKTVGIPVTGFICQ